MPMTLAGSCQELLPGSLVAMRAICYVSGMTTATAPADTSAARYSESVHVLTDKPMRAVVLGLAELEAEERGGRPKEGDTLRTLLDDAISRLARRDRERYDEALRRGTAELARRADEKATRRAARRSPHA
jgi:hypothetical protein